LGQVDLQLIGARQNIFHRKTAVRVESKVVAVLFGLMFPPGTSKRAPCVRVRIVTKRAWGGVRCLNCEGLEDTGPMWHELARPKVDAPQHRSSPSADHNLAGRSRCQFVRGVMAQAYRTFRVMQT